MPHGTPDWGASKPTTTVYTVSDMAELAARLGSIVTYDRRGDVVWMDTFEDNLNKWYQWVNGTGAAAALSTDLAKNGAKSAKLTTGNNTFDQTALYRFGGPMFIDSRTGIEVSFILNAKVNLIFSMTTFLATELYTAKVKIDPVAETLSYQNLAGAWVVLMAGLTVRPINTWHTLKLVADFSASKEYVRLLLDNLSPDVSGIKVYKKVEVNTEHFEVIVNAQVLEAANHSMYVDDFIITQNEP